MDEINIWARGDDGQVTRVDRIAQVDYENNLEETLIEHPDMLMPELTLIGRQLQTATGPLDLLGIDADGRLTVFELKRGDTPRDAITQAIDYASWLDSLSFSELSRRVSEHRPVEINRGFDTFEDWYAETFTEDQLANMRPTRIVLVGLGIESHAERMAHWLQDKGVVIDALTFHAFELPDRVLLARKVEVETDLQSGPQSSTPPPRPDPVARAAEFGAQQLYLDAYQVVASSFDETPHKVHTFRNGVNFTLPPTDDRKVQRYPAYGGVYVRTEVEGQVNIYVRPAALDVCPGEHKTLMDQMAMLDVSTYPGADWGTALVVDSPATLAKATSHITEFFNAAVAAWRDRMREREQEQAEIES